MEVQESLDGLSDISEDYLEYKASFTLWNLAIVL